MGGRLVSVAMMSLLLGLSACGGRERPLPTIRYAAVSPAGELLGPPTGNAEAYRTAMLGWFNRADTNSDGRLDLAEMMADADRTYALYDQNKDGAVTSSELTAYRVASPHHAPPVQGGEKMRPGRLNMTAAEAETASRDSQGRPQYRMGVDPVMSADANADFRVTLAEFRAEMTRRHTQMDQNGDGVVSRDEFLAYAEGPMRAWRQE